MRAVWTTQPSIPPAFMSSLHRSVYPQFAKELRPVRPHSAEGANSYQPLMEALPCHVSPLLLQHS